MDSTSAKGSRGEDLAAAHLTSLGYRILERNARTKRGELDIIAVSPDNVLCFVEVKSAMNDHAGDPASWITPWKMHRIQRGAQAWCALHGAFDREMRFDAVTVKFSSLPPTVAHFPSAFIPDGSGYF